MNAINQQWVNHKLEPLMAHLKDDCTDLAIIGPGKAFVDGKTGWRSVDLDMDMANLQGLAKSIAAFSRQDISERQPLLSAMLPGRERVQIVVPPAVPADQLSMTIRRPSHNNFPLESYVKSGYFENTIWHSSGLLQKRNDFIADVDPLTQIDGTDTSNARWRIKSEHQNQLLSMAKSNPVIGHAYELLSTRQIPEFLQLAIGHHFNICMVGDTGSGKTALMRTLCALIPPHERLISIEDVRELFLPHENYVNLMYSKGMQGVADIRVGDLIASCMRMKPDRVLLAELRGGESYDFLKLMTSGHSGSVTSFHAVSCAAAVPRFVFMAKEHPEAATYDMKILRNLFLMSVDVVAHVKAVPKLDDQGRVIGKRRVMTEIYWDPVTKEGLSFDS